MSNSIAFHGRLVKDCWTGATQSGKAMCRFTVASDVGFGDNKHTNYFDVLLIGKRAEGGLPQYLTKGASVYVSGEIKIEPPRENNGKHYNNMTVFPRDVDLIGGRSQSGNDRSTGGNANDGQRKAVAEQDFDDSEIPFLNMRGDW